MLSKAPDEEPDEDQDDELLNFDLNSLDETELRLLAEKIYERLRRELAREQDRMGRTEQWSGWIQ